MGGGGVRARLWTLRDGRHGPAAAATFRPFGDEQATRAHELHAHDVRRAEEGLRDDRRRLRQDADVWNMHRARDVWRRRSGQRLRRSTDTSTGPYDDDRADDVPARDLWIARRQLRDPQRRLRRHTELRIVRSKRIMRRHRAAQRVRNAAVDRVRRAVVRSGRRELRRSSDRLRQAAELRIVYPTAVVRRRRNAEPVRGKLRAEDVHAAGRDLWSPGRRLRRLVELRNVPHGSGLHRHAEQVRPRDELHAEDLWSARSHVRPPW